jgi:hypothetical protein
VEPLSNLLKKELSFEWKKKQHKAFEDLKDKLSSTLVLKFLHFTKLFKVHIDASDFALEGVFKQEGHLIAFESKKPCGTQL